MLERALRGPTLHTTTAAKAEQSRFVYGSTDDPDRWRLTPLGLLHALTGLTLEVYEP